MFSSLSKRTLLVIVIIWSYSFVKYERWKDYHLIQWDPLEYYSYLPQVFIKHDFSYKFMGDIGGSHWINFWTKTLPDGTVCNKRTIGLAICEAPFFFLAHATAGITGYDQDGFSLPYQIFLAISGIFHAFIGFIILRKILLRYYSEFITSLALLTLLIGTNLWSGTLLEIGLTHPYLFMLFALFLYLCIKWIEGPSYKYIIAAGLAAGLITLIRPTNILILLIPLLFGITSFEEIKNRILLFWKYRVQFVVFGICMFLVFIPQMIHWKYLSGSWILYSYGEEGFFFLKPRLIDGLFGFRKGWLLYTPIMAFALTGIFLLRKYARELFLPVLIFTILNIWIVLSWWCWWYGGSFGMRALIESYAFLVFPLAAFIRFACEKRNWFVRSAFILIFCFFIGLNLFQTYQYKITLLHWECTTKELYRFIWGTLEWPKNYQEMLKCPNIPVAVKGEE